MQKRWGPFCFVGLLCCVVIAQQLGERDRREREVRQHQQEIGSRLKGHIYNNVGPILSTLEELQAGETNAAIVGLESELYTQVYNLWYLHKQHPEQIVDEHLVERLNSICAYKRKHPGNARSPSIEQLVAQLVSLTNAPRSAVTQPRQGNTTLFSGSAQATPAHQPVFAAELSLDAPQLSAKLSAQEKLRAANWNSRALIHYEPIRFVAPLPPTTQQAQMVLANRGTVDLIDTHYQLPAGAPFGSSLYLASSHQRTITGNDQSRGLTLSPASGRAAHQIEYLVPSKLIHRKTTRVALA